MPRFRRLLAPLAAVAAALPALVAAPATATAAPVKGNARAYAFISQQNGSGPIARWNPCAGPIDYRVNLARAQRRRDPADAAGRRAAAVRTGR